MSVKHTLMIISSLDLGGAQRVLSLMAGYWVERGGNVTVMTLDGPAAGRLFPLNPKATLRPLGISGPSFTMIEGLINNVRRVGMLRKAIKHEKAEVIISFLDTTNILTLLAAAELSTPVIVTEVSDPAQVPTPLFWRILRRLTYGRAKGIVVVTPKARDYFPAFLKRKIAVIPNPVVPEINPAPYDGPLPSPLILYAGRLAEEKRIELLLRAFSLVKDKYPQWSLGIVGDGPLRKVLESLGDELHLQGRVRFFGLVESPFYFYQRADLFVLSSRFEGFPVALVEAMAAGLPVIATEYHYGVREIVSDGVNGLIVPPEDPLALSLAMDRLMGNPEERKRLGGRAREVQKRFSLEKVMEMWEAVIDRAVSGQRS